MTSGFRGFVPRFACTGRHGKLHSRARSGKDARTPGNVTTSGDVKANCFHVGVAGGVGAICSLFWRAIYISKFKIFALSSFWRRVRHSSVQVTRILGGYGHIMRVDKPTDESPPRVAMIDVATMVAGKDARKTALDNGFVRDRHPDVAQNLGLYKFNGRRQRHTHVATVRGIIEIILLPPGRYAARIFVLSSFWVPVAHRSAHVTQILGG